MDMEKRKQACDMLASQRLELPMALDYNVDFTDRGRQGAK